MELFNGQLHAQKLEEEIRQKLFTIKNFPTLGILQIGDNPSSEKFISLKIKFCEKYGIPVKYLKLQSTLTDDALQEKALSFFTDESLSGVIVQLPLPRPTLYKILGKIPPQKNIDALMYQYSSNSGATNIYYKSPVIQAVEYFINSNNIDFENREICILGYGFLVGRPLAEKMLSLKAKVTVLDDLTQKGDFSYNPNDIKFLPSYNSGNTLNYQLVISSAGIPNLLKGQDIMPKSCVIDFGSSVVNGKTVGDLDLTSKLDHLNIISPSPGGMGPLVVRFLILNLLKNAV